jgi:hypothetical protein
MIQVFGFRVVSVENEIKSPIGYCSILNGVRKSIFRIYPWQNLVIHHKNKVLLNRKMLELSSLVVAQAGYAMEVIFNEAQLLV